MSISNLLVAWIGFAPATAEPGDRPYQLTWEAPSECPASEAVERAVDQALDITVRSDQRFVIDTRVRVRQTDNGKLAMWLVMELDGTRGERRLEADTCDELVNAAAQIIAIAVDVQARNASRASDTSPPPPGDESAVVPTSPPPPVPEPVAPPVAQPGPPAPSADGPPAAPSVPAPSTSPAPKVRLGARATAGAGFSVLPGPTFVAEVALGLSGRHFRGEAAGSYFAPREIETDATPRARGEFQLGTAMLRGCGVPPPVGPVAFPLCASVEVGAMRGKGVGTAIDEKVAHALFMAVRLGPAVAWSMTPRVGLWLAGEVMIPFLRPRPSFFTARQTDLFVVPDVGAIVSLGVEFRSRPVR